MPRAPRAPTYTPMPDAERFVINGQEYSPFRMAVAQSATVLECKPSRGWRICLTQSDTQLPRGIVTVWIHAPVEQLDLLFRQGGMQIEGITFDALSHALVYDTIDNLDLALQTVNACRAFFPSRANAPPLEWTLGEVLPSQSPTERLFSF